MLLLDCLGKLNYLGSSVTEELRQALLLVAQDDSVKACVMMSAKPETFIIGADLYEIRKAESVEQLHKLSSDGHATLNLIAASRKPMVAAINGACFGGGLELALCAQWRIATNEPITQFALPETRLGLIPGLGGTQRLPRLVGLKSALGMILSADPVSAAEAKEMGLVDELVSPGELMEAAEKRALELAKDSSPIEKRIEKWSQAGGTEGGVKASSYCLVDMDDEKANKLFAMTERSVRIKTRGHYPAQTRVTEVMKIGLSQGMKAGLEAEAHVFSELAVSDVSSNLIALFFSTDFARQSAAALAAKFDSAGTQKLGIIGGGTMGASLAALAASRGMQVKVRVNPGKEAETLERIRAAEGVECTSDWTALADSEIVLEAVSEDLAIKHKVLEQVEKVVSADCTIATNTSSLPLSEVGSVLQKSDRFVGVHFFHPVDKMPLVEVVALKATNRKALARAADLVSRLEKIPAMVKDGPGFLINRLLSCYIREAAIALHDGVPITWLDDAASHFGMPMGPWEVMDEIGIDVAFTSAENLYKAFGERMKPPPVMHDFWDVGAGGKKMGRGVYLYDVGKKGAVNQADLSKIPYIKVSEEKCPEDQREPLAQRLIFPMIDEASRCLEDKIVMKPREVDMAVIHGTGFPPFRGGLLKYADRVGLKEVAARLREIYGDSPRTVSPLLEKYAAEGRGFYSRAGKEEE